jgi:hypothetical protein
MHRPHKRILPNTFLLKFSNLSSLSSHLMKWSLIAFSLLLISGIARTIQAEEMDINLDGTPAKPSRKAFILAFGAGYSIGSDLGLQPQLGLYRDLPKSWQTGLRLRLATPNSKALYDNLPQISLDFRKLWLGDEGTDPYRNSEYFSLSLGGYLAYEFSGDKIGLSPLGALTLGKYWMPFDESPFGLDIYLELSRLFSGHLLKSSELVFITTGINFIYVLPKL